MQHSHIQHKTPTELQELCNFLNWLHRRVWLGIAVLVLVGAIIKNPYHIVTAALLFGFSRMEVWQPRDLKAME